MKQRAYGFTIVELLIVIVVVAILAALSYVGYTSVQARARDAKRQSDVATIVKALELYYVNNGRYPSGNGSSLINNQWSSSADGSWQHLATQLAPYLDTLPKDPINTGSGQSLSSRHGYSYYSGGWYCGVSGDRQMYVVVFTFEVLERKTVESGECNTNLLSYPGVSWYRSAKH